MEDNPSLSEQLYSYLNLESTKTDGRRANT